MQAIYTCHKVGLVCMLRYEQPCSYNGHGCHVQDQCTDAAEAASAGARHEALPNENVLNLYTGLRLDPTDCRRTELTQDSLDLRPQNLEV